MTSTTIAEFCSIHQHYKWCEHNGGVKGEHGWTAKKQAQEAAQQEEKA